MTSPVVARRLRNTHLVGPLLADPAAVVRGLGAVQAQDYGGAKWALAQRCEGARDADVDALVDAGAILRTHVLRPTWHFVAPGDIRWMLKLTAPRVLTGSGARTRELGLDAPTVGRAQEVMARVLSGGRHLTRTQLRERLIEAGIDPAGQRLPWLLMLAELDGLICSGARAGKQHTYALLEERVPPAPGLDEDSALAELATRYFASHGPAQVNDFTWWSSLTVAQVRRGIANAGDALRQEVIDGRTYWSSAEQPPVRTRPPLVQLLPNYDEYVVAYRDRSAYYDRALDPATFRGGVMANIVAVDGVAAGNWTRRPRGRAMDVVVHPWIPFPEPVRAGLVRAAEGYSRFLGLTVNLVNTQPGHPETTN